MNDKNQNTTNLIIALAVLLSLASTARDAFSQPENETTEVTATGVGATAEDAQKNAVINAVQQVVGLYVDSEAFVKNEQLIVDQVLAVSSGFVTSFDVKSPPRKRVIDGLFETTIKAVVQKTQVVQQLNNTKISFPVNPQDAWAESFSRLKNAQDGKLLLEAYWPKVALSLLSARLVDDNGQPMKGARGPLVKPDLNTGLVWCAWNIEVSYATDVYFKDVAPRLRRIFDAICVRKAEERLSRRTPTSIDALGIRRVAISGTPIRWVLEADNPNHERRSSWSSFPETQRDQNEFNLTVMMTSDKANFLQSAESYVLQVDPYEKILVDAIINNVLVVKLIGSNSSTLLTEKLPLNHTYLEPPKPTGGLGNEIWKSGHHIPIEAELIRLDRPGLLWDSTVGHDLSRMWLIAPEFRFWGNSYTATYAVTDRILVRYETQLHPDNLKDLKEVQLSFIHQRQ
jgi:hypothetical protein